MHDLRSDNIWFKSPVYNTHTLKNMTKWIQVGHTSNEDKWSRTGSHGQVQVCNVDSYLTRLISIFSSFKQLFRIHFWLLDTIIISANAFHKKYIYIFIKTASYPSGKRGQYLSNCSAINFSHLKFITSSKVYIFHQRASASHPRSTLLPAQGLRSSPLSWVIKINFYFFDIHLNESNVLTTTIKRQNNHYHAHGPLVNKVQCPKFSLTSQLIN